MPPSLGRLSRRQTLGDFFEDVPADKRGITIQQLLQHTSGLRPYFDAKMEGVPPDHAPMTREEALTSIFTQALVSDPGTEHLYSNCGYTLLAMIIERVSGLSYVQFVEKTILAPAGMTRSGFYRNLQWTPDDVAVGYGRVRYGKENSPFYWPTNAWPVAGNGGMAGPLIDLYRGARYIESRRASSPELDRAWRETMPEGGPTEFYGSAGGNDFGFVSVVFFWPERGHAMVFASNNDSDGSEDPEMLLRLLNIAFGLRPKDLGMTAAGSGTQKVDPKGLDRIPSAHATWGLPDQGSWRRASAFLDAIASHDSTAWRRFVEDTYATSLRDAKPMDEHLGELRRMHERLGQPRVRRLERENQILMTLQVESNPGGSLYRILLELERQAPFRIVSILVQEP